ncbi:copper-translocating P-type ATPase [Erysipelothrix sp. HDW6C]|nr:copper-translocating P-type ATPase [Erysipelothrix sp. HDW6C]
MHHEHGQMKHDGMDHEAMNHGSHDGMDHTTMDHSGHGGMDHSMHGMGDLKKKFIVSLFMGVPILIFAPMMGVTLPFQFAFPGSDWVVAILATLLFFYGGMPFLKGAKMELQQKSPAMMTLISLGISVAYIYSMYAFVMNSVIKSPNHIMDFFWELASLILIMLLGHWIEMEAVSNAGNALQRMAELLPSDATVVMEDGSTMKHPLVDVHVGDKVLVKAGENMPTDGTIIAGSTSVNEAMITGEARAVKKNVGDKVIGGSVNGSGTITVEVTGTGESGYLSQVMDLVKQAQGDKSNAESMADKVAKWLFYIASGVGIVALIVWTILSGLNFGIERMVTVLVIACPHALGLAIPLVTARSTSLGAQNGLLIKNRQALEVAEHVDVLMMDKTGTLTEGNFKVTHYESFDDNYSDDTVLQYFASLEQSSSHPLAIGILEKAETVGVQLLEAHHVNTIAGVGLDGTIANKDVKITNVGYLINQKIPYDESLFMDLSRQGYSVSFLLVENHNTGIIAQGDEIKPESKAMIDALIKQGIKPVMLTGDNKQAATLIGNELGIEDVHAELMPEDKERIVKEYKERGLTVLMVGDGVNDAPSLARADVGVAIGAGTDVAIDSADVILVKSNPADILHFISLAKNTTRKMKENLLWGAGYNFIAIPLAAGVLAGVGFILSPAVGAILMSLSTVIVAINAMLLRIK